MTPEGSASIDSAGQQVSPLIAIDTPAARRYADAISVEADLSFAVETLAALMDHHSAVTEGTVAARALWIAALVSYGRAFGSGVRGYHLTTDRIGDLADGAVGFHKWLRDMRDKNAAHSVNPFEQVVVGVLLGVAESGSRGIVGTGHLAMAHVGLLKDDAAQALRFVMAVRDLVRQDLPDLEKAMLRSAEAIPLDDLCARPPAQLVAPGPMDAGRGRRTARRGI